MDLTFRGTDGPLGRGDGQDGASWSTLDPPERRVAAPPGAASERSRAVGAAVAILVAVGVVVRFVAFSHLWLDEALTVNIARLPLRQLPEALRHDGAPPLYYVLLHGWMDLFGTSTLAVRALPGVFGVAALPLTWVAAKRVSGTRVAWAALVLLAASPFAIRYSTEGRMYTLVTVLVLIGFLAALDVVKGGPVRSAVVLGAVTGLALLTHYWSFYLYAVAFLALLMVARRGVPAARAGARRGLVALVAGAVLFVPWVPVFLYQLRHTGTPWGKPGQLRAMFDTVFHFAGGYWDPGIALGLLYFALAALALFGWPVDGRRITLDLRPRPPGRMLAALAFGTLAVSVLAGQIGHSAFAVRYAAVLFPLFLLLVAVGTDVFVDRRLHGGVLALAVALGLWASVPNVVGERTNATRVAAAIEAGAAPGDVVAYCPDQLGPSVSRELHASGLVQLTFPRATAPERVDWVNYAQVNKAADPAVFALMLLDRAGPGHDVWLVWAPGYQTFKTKCQNLIDRLDDVRPNAERVVKIPTKYFERPGLVRFRAGAATVRGTNGQ